MVKFPAVALESSDGYVNEVLIPAMDDDGNARSTDENLRATWVVHQQNERKLDEFLGENEPVRGRERC